MSDEIEWKTPPENGRRLSGHVAFRVALKARPGEWAVAPFKHNSLTHVKRSIAWRGFETVTRRGVVYVRYVGEEPSNDE